MSESTSEPTPEPTPDPTESKASREQPTPKPDATPPAAAEKPPAAAEKPPAAAKKPPPAAEKPPAAAEKPPPATTPPETPTPAPPVAPPPAEPLPTESEPEEEPELDPISPEFWLGQLLAIGAVVLGIYLAASAGFAEAARFSLQQDHHAALNTLDLVHGELVSNVEQLERAKANLQEGRRWLKIDFSTEFLEGAQSRSSMTLIDPRILHEASRIGAYPLPSALDVLAQHGSRMPQGAIDYVVKVFDDYLKKAAVVLALLEDAQERLRASEAELKVGP